MKNLFYISLASAGAQGQWVATDVIRTYADATLSGVPKVVYIGEQNQAYYIKAYPTIGAENNSSADAVGYDSLAVNDTTLSGDPIVAAIQSDGITYFCEIYPELSMVDQLTQTGSGLLLCTLYPSATLSGTARVVKVILDGTPYYFKVYPGISLPDAAAYDLMEVRELRKQASIRDRGLVVHPSYDDFFDNLKAYRDRYHYVPYLGRIFRKTLPQYRMLDRSNTQPELDEAPEPPALEPRLVDAQANPFQVYGVSALEYLTVDADNDLALLVDVVKDAEGNYILAHINAQYDVGYLCTPHRPVSQGNMLMNLYDADTSPIYIDGTEPLHLY